MAKTIITCREGDKELVSELASKIFGSFTLNEDPTNADLHLSFGKSLKLEMNNNQLIICIPFEAFPTNKEHQWSVRNAMKLGAAWICGINILGEENE